ncbi:hypothetical protein [Streptomyces sp. NPDC058382]|uniref:hypothetical protein n=1 Tax=unclassified Streptomyces TaxID=2593676 RepID=UPI0036341AE2
MLDPELLERITARRAELDEFEEQPAEQPAEVRAGRDELAVAERVLERVSRQLADERAQTVPIPAQVGGRAVVLIPHREPGVDEDMLPPDYQRIVAAIETPPREPLSAYVEGRRSPWTPGPSTRRPHTGLTDRILARN